MKRTTIFNFGLAIQAFLGTLFALSIVFWGIAIAQTIIPVTPVLPVSSASSVSSVIGSGLFSPISLERNRIVYQEYEAEGGGIWSIKPDGTDPRELADHGWFPSFSPGGRKIAFSDWYDDGIWVMNADGSNPRKLTNFGTAPTWSPDESQIAFATGGRYCTNQRLWIMNADGTGLQKLSDKPGHKPHWSPNGSKILYNHPCRSEVWVIDPDGSNEKCISTRAMHASWSSNGDKIIYTSTDWRIWIMDLNGLNCRPVSQSKGLHGRMNGDGDRIVFESVDGGLIITTLSGVENRITTWGYAPDWLIGKVELPYPEKKPVFTGVGLIPWSEIADGYATTDPAYRFSVVDAPFGGILDIFGNFDHLRTAQVAKYKVLYAKWTNESTPPSTSDFQELSQAWSNYKWDPLKGKYVLYPVGLDNRGYYIIPPETEDWYLDDLLIQWDTRSFADGKYTLKLKACQASEGNVELDSKFNTLVLMIDNTQPDIAISNIYHNGAEVDSCSIVEMSSLSDPLSFKIKAWDNELHLRQYSLTAHYGDNSSVQIFQEKYVPVASNKWGGVGSRTVSFDKWPISCAYQIRLSATTRTIDGYKYLHRKEYSKHLTLTVR